MILEPVVNDMFVEIASLMAVPDVLATVPTNFSINYEPGKNSQIIASLAALDKSEDMKGLKYPLIAVNFPVDEVHEDGFLIRVKIQKLIFAYITKTNTGTEDVKEKYNSAGIFKTVLYPCYYEFFKWLARSKYTSIGDPFMFKHTKRDNPSDMKLSDEVTDHVDILEILNLEIILNQIKTC